MAYYTATCKNVQRDSAAKRTSAGKGSLGVSASVYNDTCAQDIVGIEEFASMFDGR